MFWGEQNNPLHLWCGGLYFFVFVERHLFTWTNRKLGDRSCGAKAGKNKNFFFVLFRVFRGLYFLTSLSSLWILQPPASSLQPLFPHCIRLAALEHALPGAPCRCCSFFSFSFFSMPFYWECPCAPCFGFWNRSRALRSRLKKWKSLGEGLSMDIV